MDIIYDQVVDNIPIPNGVDDEHLVDIYLNNYDLFTKYSCLRVSKTFNEFKKINKESKGYFPISFYFLHKETVNCAFIRSLLNVGISHLAYNKILKKELKLIIFIEKEPEGCNSHFDIYNVLKENFKEFAIYTSNKNYLNEDMKKYVSTTNI